MSSQTEIRSRVTAQIIEAMKAGTPPWRRPWSESADMGFPTNALTKKPYRGINVLLLQAQGFASKHWATYQQWQNIGGQVMKGERATKIVFYKPFSKSAINDDGEEEKEDFFVLREYSVFNAQQCKDPAIKLPTAATPNFLDFEPAEEAIKASGADIRFGGDRAFYRVEQDYIQLPPKQSFVSEREYYGTVTHECVHWSGHESRLNRLEKNDRFGSAAYAFEELVAEIAGCFMCTELNLPQSEDLSNQHAYLANWLTVLQGDNGAIMRAASQASKAVDFILAFSRKVEAEPVPAGVMS
jgi:antirestriction protein ArdC